MVVWDVESQVTDLKLTGHLLRRSGCQGEIISMAKVVSWEDMKNATSVAKGPGAGNLKLKIAWVSVLRVFIEVRISRICNVIILNVFQLGLYDSPWQDRG